MKTSGNSLNNLSQKLNRWTSIFEAIEPPSISLQTDDLTNKQKQIALLIRKGYSNQEIANQFSISPRTAEKHTENIFRKLKIKKRSELI